MKTKFVFYAVLILFGLNSISVFSQKVKQIKIGSLQSWYREDGGEPEHGFLKIQQAGLQWPAQYKDQDNEAAKALWIATTNYTDAPQYGGNTYLYKVVHIGPRGWDMNREFMPIELKMIGRFERPQVFVDGVPATELVWSDEVDEIDDNLECDRLIYNVVNTSIGITLTRKIMGWGQQYHDNYFIYDYIFQNTGNVDVDAEIEKPDQTLENVYFFFQCRYAVSKEGATASGLNSPRWGHSQMLTSRGEAKEEYSSGTFTYKGDYEDWLNGDPNADSLRCQIAWAGKLSTATYDLIGYPDVIKGTGRLQGPQFVGLVTLHADRSATDRSDDPQQPTTTTFQQSDDPPTRPNDQFDPQRMSEEWKWISKGHRLPRHDELVGTGFPDQVEGTPGGFSNMNGYGPYTLRPGESIRIVLAEGVNGLNRQICEQIGRNWIRNQSPYTMPDGSSVSNRDQYKNSWVMTGMDSLFRTFSRARKNFQSDFKIPMPPSPPKFFQVESGGDRVRLSWANNAESTPGFAGYRIYRSVAKYDTTYYELFSCGSGTSHPAIVNSFDDTTAIRGFSYYYYIASFNDGSNNQLFSGNPPGPLHSSMFWTRTTEPATLKRPASEDPDSIRVVPNPYNIRARDFQYPGEPDKIMFLNIPGMCKIHIFTERGDHIQTLTHDDGSGDEAWNLNTKYGQVIVSGIYIAMIEIPDQESVIRKFVVIR